MTVKFFYICFFLILAVPGELFLQSFGLSFPFAAFFIFYASTAFGWKYALFAAFAASCGLDLATGEAHFYSLAGLFITILLSRFWLYKVESDSIFLHIIPGGLIPFIMRGTSFIFHGGTSLHEFLYNLAGLLGGIICGMIYLPLVILLLDTLNESMGLALYSNAKLELEKDE